jgi:hypothetical protein
MALRSIKRGLRAYKEEEYIEARKKTALEGEKTPSRTVVINYLLNLLNRDTLFLEIGIRNPEDNYDHVQATKKYSVDPGIEHDVNHADFPITSDEFFEKLRAGVVLDKDIRFDVIFVDGLHLAEQADRDIANSFEFLKEDGFVVVHDCNPPTVWHARETFNYQFTPAEKNWNGTTWKAFVKWRMKDDVSSCCIDSDWGIGILTKAHSLGPKLESDNPYFEYHIFNNSREQHLNLVSFEEFKAKLK